MKKKNVKELKISLINLLREQFSLQLKLSSKKLQKPHFLRLVRRNIARVKFLLTRKGKYSE
ncbi:MAG: 50S ribosomal protein L29 [Buchnera aphidicola (Schlechtendalia peitan)]